MSNNVLTKLMTKFKNKINNKDDYLIEEYKFSTEEIEDLKEQNKQKIENLKNGTPKRKNVSFTSVSKKLSGILDETSNKKEVITEEDNSNEKLIEESVEELPKEEDIPTKEDETEVTSTEEEKKSEESPNKQEEKKDSYINLSPKNQEIIMKNWNEIDLQQIDKDIIEGKDLLNHNYNITYGDNAAKFVHDIRKKYEIVICYLIGFNNEKKGILNKTTFSDRVDDEWKHLNRYIKLLEKIRSFRK